VPVARFCGVWRLRRVGGEVAVREREGVREKRCGRKVDWGRDKAEGFQFECART